MFIVIMSLKHFSVHVPSKRLIEYRIRRKRSLWFIYRHLFLPLQRCACSPASDITPIKNRELKKKNIKWH